METTIKTNKTTVLANSTGAHASNSSSAYDRWIEKLNFSYFSIIAMTITIGSILGGFAAMTILQNDAPIWELGIAMALSMANNVVGIGQAPIKWVVNLFFLCVGVNSLLIIINSI